MTAVLFGEQQVTALAQGTLGRGGLRRRSLPVGNLGTSDPHTVWQTLGTSGRHPCNLGALHGLPLLEGGGSLSRAGPV